MADFQLRLAQVDNFDFNLLDQSVELYVGPDGISGACGQFEVTIRSITVASPTTAVLDIQYSFDRQTWLSLGPLNIVSGNPGSSGIIYHPTARYVRAIVTTKEGSACVGRACIQATDAPFIVQ